jgi:hypothetical protein
MQSQESVRQILKEAIEITKEVPEGLQMIAFPKIFDFLAGSQAKGMRTGGFHAHADSRPEDLTHEKTARRTRSGNGPKQTTAQAVEDGFFDQPQTIETLAQHLKQDLAVRFERKHLATALARLVRDGRLRRKQNEDGKYAYQKI